MLDYTRVACITYVNHRHEMKQSEKRREKIIWNLKRQVARRNRFIVGALLSIGILLTLAGAMWLCFLVRNPLMPIASGYTGFQLIRLQYAFLTEAFECNPSYVGVVKHKGKEYY